MRRDVGKALQNGEGHVRRRCLKRETFAYQPGELILVFEGVETRDDAAGTVSEQKNRKTGVTGGSDCETGTHVTDVLVDVFDVEPFAGRLAAPPEIHGVRREAGRDELFSRP